MVSTDENYPTQYHAPLDDLIEFIEEYMLESQVDSLLKQAIDMSGNEFSMGYDDSACQWHFHAGVRGNGRQLFEVEFTSDNPNVLVALQEYVDHCKDKNV